MATAKEISYIYKDGKYYTFVDGAARDAAATAQATADSRPTLDQIYDQIYPVGSIYMSVNPASPAALFGGTWEQIKDMFLLSAGDTYTSGDTGGEATHTLVVDEMPSHSHVGRIAYGQSGYGINLGAYSVYIRDGASNTSPLSDTVTGSKSNINSRVTANTLNSGGGSAHNNMPPYLVVYVWKRVEDAA